MTEPTPCRACADAEANPRTGSYRSDCIECNVRALAKSPAQYEARAAGKMMPDYLRALDLLVADGDAQLEPDGKARDAMHVRVKAWAAKINGARA